MAYGQLVWRAATVHVAVATGAPMVGVGFTPDRERAEPRIAAAATVTTVIANTNQRVVRRQLNRTLVF